jgi:hypothetical protein
LFDFNVLKLNWFPTSKNFYRSPFSKWPQFCSTDSDFLAYLVPIDVDVVPMKFHQFLFGE